MLLYNAKTIPEDNVMENYHSRKNFQNDDLCFLDGFLSFAYWNSVSIASIGSILNIVYLGANLSTLRFFLSSSQADFDIYTYSVRILKYVDQNTERP